MTGAPVQSVAVVGLGLIGGSVARDLAARGARVLGYDRDAATLEAACAAGVVHEPLDSTLAGLHRAAIVVVAVPVSAVSAVLTTAAPHLARTCLVTDVGSTKRSIVAAAESLGIGDRFVGSHPMAGDHRSGWAAARRGLFVGATTYLCPTRSAGDDALTLARELWRTLGARPELIDAGAHDRRLAYASHLPQAAATALALALAEAGVSRAELGPGGRDGTRLAGSSVEMWAAVTADNAAALAPAVAALEAQLARLHAALTGEDVAELRAIFAAGRAWFAHGHLDQNQEGNGP